MADEAKIRIEVQSANAIKNLEKFGVQVDKTTNKVKIDLDKMGDSFQRVGRRLSLFVSAPLTALGAVAVKTAGEFEKQQIAFETMLGSAEKAKGMLEDLITYSAKTPFQLPQIEDVAAQLLSFGVASDEVIDKIKMLGDVAMGDSEKLGRLAHAFGRLRSRGKATMEELNMFIEAGVPILDQLAKQFHVTQGELFKMVTQGKVSFQDINNALKTMTSEGGQFYKMTEKQSQSFLGLFSTMRDNVGLLLKDFGDMLLPTMKKVVNSVTGFVAKLREMSDSTKRFLLVLGGVVTAIPLLITGIGMLMKAFSVMKTGLVVVRGALGLLTNPIGLVIVAVGALATAGYLMVKNWDKVKEGMKKIFVTIKDFAVSVFGKLVAIVLTPVVKILEGLKRFVGIFGGEGQKLQNAINSLSGVIGRNNEKFSSWAENTKNNVKVAITNLGDKIAGLTDKLKGNKDEVDTGTIPTMDGLRMRADDLAKSLDGVNDSLKKQGEQLKQAIIPLGSYQGALKRTGEYVRNFQKDIIDMSDTYAQFGVTAEDMNSIMQDSFINAWESIWDVTENFKKRMKEAIKELFITMLKAIGKKMIIAAAGYALAGQWGKAAMATALSVAAYAAASEINSLQQGGVVQGYGGGDVVPALLEPGEMVIRKEVVKENTTVLQAMNSGEPAPMHISLYIGSRLIYDDISRATRDGKIIIDKRAVR